MRHEKINLEDLALRTLPVAVPIAVAVPDEADSGGPPVLQQHFFYCGRVPSRKRATVQAAKVQAAKMQAMVPAIV